MFDTDNMIRSSNYLEMDDRKCFGLTLQMLSITLSSCFDYPSKAQKSQLITMKLNLTLQDF